MKTVALTYCLSSHILTLTYVYVKVSNKSRPLVPSYLGHQIMIKIFHKSQACDLRMKDAISHNLSHFFASSQALHNSEPFRNARRDSPFGVGPMQCAINSHSDP